MAKEGEKKIKKVGIGLVLAWIFSFLAIIAGVADMFYSFAGGLLIILAGIIISPAFCSFVKEKFKIELTGWLKFLIFIILLIIGGILISNSLAYKTITGNGIANSIESQTEQKAEIQSTCTPNWQCHEWSACTTNGIQTRICFDSNNCHTSSGKPEESKTCTLQITAFQIGQTVLVGSIAYRVNKVSTASESGKYYGSGEYESFMGEKANGIFYIVDITIENKGKESENMFAPTLKLVDDQEREFDYDISAEIYYEEGDKKAISFGEQLQPGLPITGVKIFDLPKDAKGIRLKILGSGLSTAKAFVDLGK